MDFPVVSGSIVLLRSCDWLGTFKNQGSSGYCNGGDWQGALWKRKNWARDYARGTGKRGYCIYKPSMQPALSSPSPHPASPPEGLRRRVERCPQRVLNTAVHFTACKAIISIPTSVAYPPTPSFCSRDCWVSSPSYGEWLPQPRRYWFAPVCKGEVFPNLSGQFCCAAKPAGPLGIGLRKENNINITTTQSWTRRRSHARLDKLLSVGRVRSTSA